MTIFRVMHAEMLKLKRTLAFRMVFVAPLLVATLQFFVLLQRHKFSADFKLWDSVFRMSLNVWAVFLMPLLITLETALLSGLEHGEKQWKHILALPVTRRSVYLVKLFTAHALIMLSTLFLLVLSFIVGLIAMRLRSELANSGWPDFVWVLKHAGMVWLASWLILAIHTWISIRWASFTVTLGAGVAGTFFALFAASAKAGKYYPWLLPVNVFSEERLP
ncbi:MAG TPA: ABC transporter permease, partial [Blastocatellia bacterium]|nr:ABC transporter permease [Blastocatellia bacterium]